MIVQSRCVFWVISQFTLEMCVFSLWICWGWVQMVVGGVGL
jgi:hypothetical protein